MTIFRKKEIKAEASQMSRHLTVFHLILLGLGSMVGTGIFTITGIGAAKYAGPALVISIIIAAVAVGISALFFAEFASRIPSSGGAYSYIYVTLGEFPAWMTGWYTILVSLMAVSSVASGWAGYFKGFLSQYGIALPQALNGPFDSGKGQYLDLLPVLVLFGVTWIVLLNSKSALKFNGILVILKFSAMILFLAIGIFYIKPDHWTPFSPFGFGGLLTGHTGIMAGASLMFFAFLGYESISVAVDETHDPQKNIPRGIILSLLLVTIFYVVITLVLTGIIPYTNLNVNDSLAFALRQIGMTWAANYISTVAILTLITVCISMMYVLARIIYNLSRDGLLPKRLGIISEKTRVPRNATLLSGILAMIFAGFLPLETIAEFATLSTFSYLILLAIGIILLRRDRGLPHKGEFKTPFVPVLPIISIGVSLLLMTQYQLLTWFIFVIASLIGVAIYICYGYKHSVLVHHDLEH